MQEAADGDSVCRSIDRWREIVSSGADTSRPSRAPMHQRREPRASTGEAMRRCRVRQPGSTRARRSTHSVVDPRSVRRRAQLRWSWVAMWLASVPPR